LSKHRTDGLAESLTVFDDQYPKRLHSPSTFQPKSGCHFSTGVVLLKQTWFDLRKSKLRGATIEADPRRRLHEARSMRTGPASSVLPSPGPCCTESSSAPAGSEVVMKRAQRVVLVAFGALILILLIAPFLIPVNSFRPAIEQRASQALGRKVQLGDLSLSLISGSLSAENLSIGDDPKFSTSPFLTAKSLKVGVQVLPLIFSKALNVTGVTIDSPQVTLLHNPAGVWNFSSLGGPTAKAQANQAPAGKTPSAPEELSIKKFALTNGKITVGATDSQKRSTYDNLNITAADFSMTSKFPV